MAAVEAFMFAQAQQPVPPVLYASNPIAWEAWRADRERRRQEELLLLDEV